MKQGSMTNHGPDPLGPEAPRADLPMTDLSALSLVADIPPSISSPRAHLQDGKLCRR